MIIQLIITIFTTMNNILRLMFAASNEFSKLKFIKNILKYIMHGDHLKNLMLLIQKGHLN